MFAIAPGCRRNVFPLFVKPVKSFFSVGGPTSEQSLSPGTDQKPWARSAAFFRPFEILFRNTPDFPGNHYLLAEGLLQGVQTTLDGYYNGEVQIAGVVDSIMFPNTIAFSAFRISLVLASVGPGTNGGYRAESHAGARLR